MNKTFILKFPFHIAQGFFWILSLILIVFCLCFYLFQINEIAKSSYLISKYEKQKTFITQNTEFLQTNLFQVGSLENIDKLVNNLNFDPVTKIHYIKVLEKTVVKKETNHD